MPGSGAGPRGMAVCDRQSGGHTMISEQISTTRLVGAVTLTPALPGHLHAILDLVRAVHLPPEGIAETIAYFWVAREGERIIGTVGLEVYDDLAFLRSLAVTPARQHTGLGSALTETALAYLTTPHDRGVSHLTTSAEPSSASHAL